MIDLTAGLIKDYWNGREGIFFDRLPDITAAEPQNYWWMAHAIDVMTDAYARTGDVKYKEYAGRTLAAVIRRNSGRITNDYYDDMQWMALALLRLHGLTGEYMARVTELWEDIKGGWNDNMGGGIAWRKPQLDYKNTPANAPAAILAARLYSALGSPQDLDWAKKLFEFVDSKLTDKQTGQVWDGMNRQGDGEIDKDWCFTYCHGVYIGAALELYKITGAQAYLAKAELTADFALAKFTREDGALARDGKGGDGGLFAGILARYLAELYKLKPDEKIRAVICASADIRRESGPDLSARLSDAMLFEMAAAIK